MKIRAAKIEDDADLAKVQIESYRTAYAHIFPKEYLDHFTHEEQTQDWRDLISANQTDVLLVAVIADEVIGYALGHALPKEVEGFDSELMSLHVRHSYHRQNVGRGLVCEIAEELKRQGCASLMLWVLEENSLARGFYEHLGGVQFGKKEAEFGEHIKLFEVGYGWKEIADLI